MLIRVGLPYCDRCRPAAEAAALESAERKAAHRRKAYDRVYNRSRDPKYLIFYRSKDWRTLSRFILQRAGYKCQAGLEGCSRLAVEVHHRVPIKTDEGWEARFDPDGLMAVCVSCHNVLDNKHFQRRKTAAGVIDQRAVEAGIRAEEEKHESVSPL